MRTYAHHALYSCFFFQAEDGIRDDLVTGVQTCALPIYKQLKNNLKSAKPTKGSTYEEHELYYDAYDLVYNTVNDY